MQTHSLSVNAGFTLIEVLLATAITALLLSAITLNLGVRQSLVRSLENVAPSTLLSERLDSIVDNTPQSELEALVGIAATANRFSDPASSTKRKLVSITSVPVSAAVGAPTVIQINISVGSSTLNRWLNPQSHP